MSGKPIRVFYSQLGGRFYATQYWKQDGNVIVITGKKYDVTNDIAYAVLEHDLEFTPVEVPA